MNIIIQDCFEYLEKAEPNSVDLIYINPPFGTTENEWDTRWSDKELQHLFMLMDKVIKPNGNIVIHCSIPFTYRLIKVKQPKYHWVWDKMRTGCPFLAKRQPLRKTEEILVYHKNKCCGKYYPQMEGEDIRTITGGKSNYYGRRHKKSYKNIVKGKYPTNLLSFKRIVDGYSTRPVSLIEYIINTYTQEGDIILDFTCYKGLSGKVSKSLNRKWIGVDIKDWN